jgi:sec-independent protein translocase protein TatB
MFDIGLSKIALISVVALVVLGPERLPRVARTAGNLFGRAQRYMADVKSEVSRQMEQEELKKLKEAATEAFQSAKNDFKDINQTLHTQVEDIGASINQMSASLSGNLDTFDQPIEHPAYAQDPSSFAKSLRQGRQSWRNKKGVMPMWFKHSTGIKVRVQSGAARVKRFRRVASHTTSSRSFFG